MYNKRTENRICVWMFRREPPDNHRRDYILPSENVPVDDPSNKEKQDRAS